MTCLHCGLAYVVYHHRLVEMLDYNIPLHLHADFIQSTTSVESHADE